MPAEEDLDSWSSKVLQTKTEDVHGGGDRNPLDLHLQATIEKCEDGSSFWISLTSPTPEHRAAAVSSRPETTTSKSETIGHRVHVSVFRDCAQWGKDAEMQFEEARTAHGMPNPNSNPRRLGVCGCRS
jgi:hypothetical protein